MLWLTRFLGSSIGKKFRMALTGLLLCGFLAVHLGGNLFLYKGREAFNHYAEALAQNPLLALAEFGLAFLFLAHIAAAVRVRIEDRRARPARYECYRSSGGRTWGSATMIFSGILLLAFLLVHLKSFRFAEDNGDVYGLVIRAFRDPLYSSFYVAAMGALALHLSHGFQGGFQTLGISHPKYTPWIERFGLAFAVLVSLGFASMPAWVAFAGGGR